MRSAPRCSAVPAAGPSTRRTSAPGARRTSARRRARSRRSRRSSARTCAAAAARASPPASSGKPAATPPGLARYVVCNADEGEPGTFKDRVLLASHADLVFDGMTVAAYAIGASQGFLYLRGEYRYLLESLEATLERRRAANLLGNGICGPGRLRLRHPHPRRRGLVRLRRGVGADRVARGQARRAAQPPAVPGHATATSSSRRSSTTSRRCARRR